MDTFVEQIVRKKKTGMDIAIILGICLACAVVAFFAIAFLAGLGILLTGGACWGAWWLITNRNREFEYSITNGSIDIDEIIAQRKRKRIVSVNGDKIESAGMYNAAEMAGRHFDRHVMAAPSETEPELWYFTYHSKKNGHTIVLFLPDERVLGAFKESLPKLLQLEMSRKYGK